MIETVRFPMEVDFSDWNISQRKCLYLVAQQLQPFWGKIDFAKLDEDWETYIKFLKKELDLDSYCYFHCKVNIRLLSVRNKIRSSFKNALMSLTKDFYLIEKGSSKTRGRIFFPFIKIIWDEVDGTKNEIVMGLESVRFFLEVINNNYRNVHIPSVCKLNSTTSMDVYEFISKYHSLAQEQGSITISLEKFRTLLHITEDTPWARIQERWLIPSRMNFIDERTLLNFNFQPVYKEVPDRPIIRGRKPVTHIQFEIFKQVQDKTPQIGA